MVCLTSSSSSSAAAFFKASWFCALFVVALLVLGLCDCRDREFKPWKANTGLPCDEIYVVGEGETLHTISDKCGAPFIVEENPHIQDPDDVYPGLVIKITPYNV
ncbi:hypothetical protein QJS04_geneDACA008449 [Acorus gramineus]|uniref:LysM domain-containing protein n=1 Tax=Acorus gramineus TaxID=55184 RepID=A0AAV9AJB7_ACOGR|nr:hypothetical protein QJS04_geneDACA008449 [Acorus gramineus]